MFEYKKKKKKQDLAYSLNTVSASFYADICSCERLSCLKIKLNFFKKEETCIDCGHIFFEINVVAPGFYLV